MVDRPGGERRYNEPLDRVVIKCRLCWEMIQLVEDRLDTTGEFPFYRCSHCENWFRIRDDDVDKVRANVARTRRQV